jgi:UDP-N-acetylmuramoyl-L-alanyl-D-glutamate--2,6-diaminopimelate ligase
MRVAEIIAGMAVRRSSEADPEVSGITFNSRQVKPGDLFVALTGQRFDGRAFVPDALERGAVAVLAAGDPPEEFQGLWLTTAEPRWLMGPIAARIFGHPERDLLIAGVTGTNGKSTVVHILESILNAADIPSGCMGTLGYRFKDEVYPGERTTPESADLYRTFRKMRDAGAEAVCMEVSSHGLEQGRVEGLSFDLAIFTNLSRDHFDFHHGFEDYFSAKRKLFERLKSDGWAVVNLDDPYGRRMAAGLPQVVTFGKEGDVRVLRAELDSKGIRADLATPRGSLSIQSPLLGGYNLENLLAAVAGGEALGLPVAALVQGIADRPPLSGRMEPIECGQPFPVLLDYAHTDAALEAALRSLKEFSRRKVLLVFGCGGDRDTGKRVLMGRVAGELADFSIITSDNPRREDPLEIIASIEEGLKESGASDYRILPDRREAIRRAVGQAEVGWAILIAGKGHEEVQILGDQELPFSDRKEMRRVLEERFGSRPTG